MREKCPPCFLFNSLYPKSCYFMTCSFHHCICTIPLHLFADPQLLASVFNMTKRDSVFAGIDSPRAPTSMQRRQSHFDGQSSSGATSSGDRSQPSTAMGTLPQNPQHETDHSDSYSHAHHYGYTSVSPFLYPMDLPTISMKKLTHSRRRSNNNTEFSTLTSSKRSYLLTRQASIALW